LVVASFDRDIIDVEATYAGPGAKVIPTARQDVVVPPILTSPPLSGIASDYADRQVDDGATNDIEHAASLAAIEAELKPATLATLNKIADSYRRLRRLQHRDISARRSPLCMDASTKS
jgi:RNA polymerase primary sigma factor